MRGKEIGEMILFLEITRDRERREVEAWSGLYSLDTSENQKGTTSEASSSAIDWGGRAGGLDCVSSNKNLGLEKREGYDPARLRRKEEKLK